MFNLDEKFNYLLEESKKSLLSGQEKERIKLGLMEFMKRHPAPKPQRAVYDGWLGGLLFKRMSFVFPVLLAVVFFGAGISLAAEESLPGELFYPIKTNINEKVLAWVTFSDQKKAKLQIDLAQKRLQEAEEAAFSERLSPTAKAQIESSLNKNIENAKLHISAANDAGLSAQLNSALEGSLKTHSRIIEKLVDKKQKNMLAARQLVETINQKAHEASRSKEESQVVIFSKNESGVHNIVTAALKNNQENRQEALRLLEENKNDISDSAYLSAKQNILGAEGLATEGQRKIEEGHGAEAFIILEKSTLIYQEMQIKLKADINLKINFQMPDIDAKKDGDQKDTSDDILNTNINNINN